MRRLLRIGVPVISIASVLSAQQSPTAPVVFRAAVDYVEVDATVSDSRGNAVTNLTAADFEIFEDGKPQTIASFSRVDLPVQRVGTAPLVSVAGSSPIVPDVQTNAPIEGGIYLIVLDDLHTGFGRTARVKEIARQFIDRAVGPNDVAAVVYTGHNDANQDFTGNRQLLLSAVDKFAGDKLRSATLVALDAIGDGRNLRGPGIDPALQLGEDVIKDVRAHRARTVMGSIRQLSEFMAGIRGRRKAMVLFGEGIDYNIEQALGAEGSTAAVIRDETRTAIASAQRGNVTIYSVDPRGSFNPADELIQSVTLVNRDSPGQTPMGGVVNSLGRKPPAAEANVSTLQAEVRVQQDSLKALAQDTGGFATLDTNNFLRPFERIIRENTGYYLIGYESTNDQRDGRQRTLQVRVTRPGLTVKARNGYRASPGTVASPAGDAASPVVEALGSPLPVSGIPMRVFAAPFKGPKDLATVTFAVELDPSAFNFVSQDGRWIESLEMATTIVPAGGTPRPGDHSKKALALMPALYDAVKTRGARILGQTELPPGRYQLRVAAGTTAKTGNTIYDLDVPDYSKAPLMLSGLVLSSDDALQTPTMPIRTEAPAFPSGPPAVTRSFSANDQLTLFGEVYDNTRSDTAREVSMTTTLRNATGVVVRTAASKASPARADSRVGVSRFIAQMRLADLTPGRYVLRVEARGNFGDKPSASRDIPILVAP